MRLVLCLLFLLLTPPAVAEPLKEILRLALENNPKVRLAKEELKVSEMDYRKAVSGFFPELHLRYSRTSLSDTPDYSVSFPGAPKVRFDVMKDSFYTFTLSLQQPIYTGGRLFYRARQSARAKESAFFLFKEVLLKVATVTKEDYYSYLEAVSAVRIAQEHLKAMREHLKVVRAFYEEGVVPRRDLLEAQLSLRRSEEELEKAKNLEAVALERLKADTGYTLKELAPEPNGPKCPPFPLKEDLLVSLAFENRPLLFALRKAKRGADCAVKLSYSRFLPSVFLDLSYSRTDSYPGRGTFDYTSVSVVLDFPVFKGLERFWEVRRAKAERRKAERKLEEAMNAVRFQVVSAVACARSALARLKTAEAMVERAEKLLEDAKERYRERVGTSTEVVDAIDYMTTARETLNTAVADFNRALARLEGAVGVPVSRMRELLLK